MASDGLINTDILSDETFDFLCTMCKRKNKNNEAEQYCVECNDYYCLSCVKVHEDVPSLTGHQILIKSQFQQETCTTPPMVPTERCKKHSHKLVDMYCRSHDEVCCAICLSVEHRPCHDIFYIPEFVQNTSNISTPRDIQDLRRATTKQITDYRGTLQHEKQRLLASKAKELEKIRKTRTDSIDRLCKLEENSISDLERVFKPLINEIEETINSLQTNEARIKSARDNITAAANNLSQVFVSQKIESKAADNVKQLVDENKSQIDIPEFRADKRILALLNEVKCLGMITKRSKETPDLKDIPTSECKALRHDTGEYTSVSDEKLVGLELNVKAEHNDNSVSTEAMRAKINAVAATNAFCNAKAETKGPKTTTGTGKRITSNQQQERDVLLHINEKKMNSTAIVVSDEYKCNIVGACALENGTIILCDDLNKNLKRLDCSTCTIDGFCKLPETPWQVCEVNGQDVAVSLESTKKICFISVSEMTKLNTIILDHGCYGLAYSNGNLYISDRHTSVYIYTAAGRKLKHFSNDLLKSQGLFSQLIAISLQGIAVNNDGSRIYVTHRSNGLIVLDDMGKVVGHYNGKQLNLAFGCHYLTGAGLLVCGSDSNNILQFGPNARLIGEVLKSDGGQYKRQTVCCNKQMSKMIVCRSNAVYIEIYDLE